MMNENQNIFINKKILVYGLGKSGISSFKFLDKNNQVFLFDDNKNIKLNNSTKKKLISSSLVKKIKFDLIVLSPGIDNKNCKLNKFLKKNSKITYSDLDIFFSFYKNTCITITGTNGKSTTCQLLYQVLKKQKYDVRLAGNIGYPILSLKNIKNNTLLVIEASSYQLEYSRLFKSKYAAIINISPDHLERHKTMNKYISAKLKLIKNQNKNSIAFINKYDKYTQTKIKKIKYRSKIIKVDTKLKKNFINIFKNKYFFTASNKENLSFVIELAKIFNIKKINLIEAVKKFKGLNYRQQIIFNNKDISIINDSKSTSYSSSIEMLKKKNNIYWLMGGIPKKGDKFSLSRKYYQNIKGYIFGINQKKFSFDLKKKIRHKKFSDLTKALDQLFKDVKKDNSSKKTILFSPAAASFDSFKNFEDRGEYFNKIIRKYINVR
ncbi:UDP-N-acetylmuramoyl-L-alanine--D-glutamate ligase [Pelagibacterales bacterium SAG-MED09]|nr:UDP-N-acetylmuramoyl-L-alanine--D-glutamate ligase [Pelagibacterales bacterium SAG-MED09]